MSQSPFIRSATGKIINTAHVLVFETRKASNWIGSSGKAEDLVAVVAQYPSAREYISFHSSQAEADHELDCLFAKLTGWESIPVPVTQIAAAPRRPVNHGPDPFDDTDEPEEL